MVLLLNCPDFTPRQTRSRFNHYFTALETDAKSCLRGKALLSQRNYARINALSVSQGRGTPALPWNPPSEGLLCQANSYWLTFKSQTGTNKLFSFCCTVVFTLNLAVSRSKDLDLQSAVFNPAAYKITALSVDRSTASVSYSTITTSLNATRIEFNEESDHQHITDNVRHGALGVRLRGLNIKTLEVRIPPIPEGSRRV